MLNHATQSGKHSLADSESGVDFLIPDCAIRTMARIDYAQCHFFAGIGIWSSALRAAGLLNVMSAAA